MKIMILFPVRLVADFGAAPVAALGIVADLGVALHAEPGGLDSRRSCMKDLVQSKYCKTKTKTMMN